MSRSCQSATFSSAGQRVGAQRRAPGPQIALGQTRVALVRHRADEPFWPSPNGSSTSQHLGALRARGPRARSSPSEAPAIASALTNSAWRSRCTIWVETGSTPRPSSRQTSSSISGATWAKLPTAPESLPTGDRLARPAQRAQVAPGLRVPRRTLRPNVVGSACTPCVRATIRVSRCRRAPAWPGAVRRRSGPRSADRPRREAAARSRCPHVVGGEPDVDEARVGAELLLQAGEQRDHLVLDASLDREDPLDVDPRARGCESAPQRECGRGGRTTSRHRHFHPEPRADTSRPRSRYVPWQAGCTARSRPHLNAKPHQVEAALEHPLPVGAWSAGFATRILPWRRCRRQERSTPSGVDDRRKGALRVQRSSAGRFRRSSGPSVVSAS